MQSSITHIKILTTKTGKPYWGCTLANGGKPNIFDSNFDVLSMYPHIMNELVGAKKGQQFELTPDIPVAVAENHRGYLNVINVEYMPDVQIELMQSKWESDHFKRLAYEQAMVTFKYLTNEIPVIVFDAETTGKENPLQDEIVSFGIASVKHEVYELVKPTAKGMHRLQTSGAMDIHHITPERLADEQSFAELYDKVYDTMKDSIWCIYNADFDVTLFDSLCIRHNKPLIPRAGVYCIMKLFAQYMHVMNARCDGWTWFKLTEAVETMGLDVNGAHNAYDDSLMTYQLMQAVAERG